MLVNFIFLIKKIKEQFNFNSFSKEKIDNIIKEKSNQDSFNFICRYGLIDFYDEYINKENVDASADNKFSIRWASENGHLSIFNRLLEDPRVCEKLENNWLEKNLSNQQKEIYNHTLSMVKLKNENFIKRKTNKRTM